MLRDHQGTLIRWLFGVGLLGLAYHFATKGYESGNLSRVVGGAGLFLLGFAFLWKTIFHLATRLPPRRRGLRRALKKRPSLERNVILAPAKERGFFSPDAAHPPGLAEAGKACKRLTWRAKTSWMTGCLRLGQTQFEGWRKMPD